MFAHWVTVAGDRLCLCCSANTFTTLFCSPPPSFPPSSLKLFTVLPFQTLPILWPFLPSFPLCLSFLPLPPLCIVSSKTKYHSPIVLLSCILQLFRCQVCWVSHCINLLFVCVRVFVCTWVNCSWPGHRLGIDNTFPFRNKSQDTHAHTQTHTCKRQMVQPVGFPRPIWGRAMLHCPP